MCRFLVDTPFWFQNRPEGRQLCFFLGGALEETAPFETTWFGEQFTNLKGQDHVGPPFGWSKTGKPKIPPTIFFVTLI